jgi:hypothetical protein
MIIYQKLMTKYQRLFTNDYRHHSTIVERTLQIRPFFCKTNPIFPIFRSKTMISLKNKPNSNPIFNPRCELTCFGVYPRVCLPFVLPGVGGKPNNQSSLIDNQLRGKPNFRKAEINEKHLFAESYDDKTGLGLCENKPNSNPKQSRENKNLMATHHKYEYDVHDRLNRYFLNTFDRGRNLQCTL